MTLLFSANSIGCRAFEAEAVDIGTARILDILDILDTAADDTALVDRTAEVGIDNGWSFQAHRTAKFQN